MKTTSDTMKTEHSRSARRRTSLATLILAAALIVAPASGADTVYVSFQNNNSIMRFTPAGAGSVFANTGLSGPRGIAFDSAGYLYAANSDNTIMKFASDGSGSLFAITGLNHAYGLAFDSADNLYAAIYSSNMIMKFTPGGVGSVFANTGASPIFIAVIPEPSTGALLGLGLPALLVCRRKTWSQRANN